jgi:uncharacterized spore protein YtfJ
MIELRAGAPMNVAGMTLIPIERIRIDSLCSAHGHWIQAIKEPVAVVLCTKRGARAIAVDGREQSLQTLCDRVPRLAAIIDDAKLASG